MRKKIFWGTLTIAYLALVVTATMLARGRSLQEWVLHLVPPGFLQELLLYPLQHHHPITFAKFIVLGDILANIFLFIPLGMIIFLVFDRMFMYSQKHVISIALFTGLSLSMCIELVQYLVPKRIPSVSDVLANTAGGLLGSSLFYLRQRTQKRPPAAEPPSTTEEAEQKGASEPRQ